MGNVNMKLLGCAGVYGALGEDARVNESHKCSLVQFVQLVQLVLIIRKFLLIAHLDNTLFRCVKHMLDCITRRCQTSSMHGGSSSGLRGEIETVPCCLFQV